MDAKQMAEYIGSKASWKVQGIKVEVRIKDMRANYGRVDALIEPVSGEGQKWVDVSGLILPDEVNNK